MRALACLAATVFCGGAAWADCAAERDSLAALLGVNPAAFSQPGTLSEADGTCLLEGVVMGQGSALSIEVAALSWQADGFESLPIDPAAPLSIDLAVTGLRILPLTGDPWLDYSQRLQTRRNTIDGQLAARWDPVIGVLELDRLTVALLGGNGLQLSSRVTGVGAIFDRGWIEAAAEVRMDRLDLTIENEGYLDGLLVGAILGQLTPLPGSPRSVVEGTLRELKTMVAAWPPEVFPDPSRDALIRLLDAGPLPWGRFNLRLAEGTLSLDRLLALGLHPEPLGPQALGTAFAGAVFEVGFVELPAPR